MMPAVDESEMLFQQLRAHRHDVVFRHMISAHSTVNLVKFSRSLFTSVEMTKMTESRGTMHIQMKAGEDIASVLKKIGEHDPQKSLAFVRILGRLLHNLYIMKYTLSENQYGCRGKKRGRDFGDVPHPLQTRGKFPRCYDMTLQTGSGNSVTALSSLSGTNTNHTSSTKCCAPFHTTNNGTIGLNKPTSFNHVNDIHCMTSFPGGLSNATSNSEAHAMSAIVNEAVTFCKKFNDSHLLGFNVENAQPQGNKVMYGKLTQMHLKGNENKVASLLHHNKLCLPLKVSNDVLSSDSQLSVRAQKVLDRNMPCSHSSGTNMNNSGSNTSSAQALELVAVGGQTVELLAGETVQVLPYSTVMCPEHESLPSSECKQSLNQDHEAPRKVVTADDTTLLLDMSNSWNQTDDSDDVTCLDGLLNIPASESHLWSYGSCEQIEQDSQSGRTFFNL